MNAIEVRGLTKTYRKGFLRRRVDAVHAIDFAVLQGEAFGFLGPNGAGKTTTMRMLMGLIAPTAGTATIFGHQIPNREARQRLGFLPEAPYFYDYLSVSELLDFTGRLFGQNAAERAKRGDELIELVGLQNARNSALKSYSKGMLQRAGIAQALMNDPDLVVFDEPMSGLDPIGRKDVRDIILGLKEQGKTVFFSSHILSDVESVADRIAIIVRGKIHDVGRLREIVSAQIGTEIVMQVASIDKESEGQLCTKADRVRRHDGDLTVMLGPGSDIDAFVRNGHDLGAKLISITPIHETLEDVFVRAANDGENETTPASSDAEASS
ncbi:MAG: ABC transporter ATP-binding protein [Myxococcales bacterium]|nr:ABC transporter ATP-binding protein [Myxococcales bacterium]